VCTNFVQMVQGRTQTRGKEIERIPKDSTIDEIKGRSLDRTWLRVPIALT
jgi:hypothetical protein